MNSLAGQNLSHTKQASVLARSLLKRALRQRVNQALCACILVCSLIASSIAVFSQGVQSALDHDIANYLGAPLVVRSNKPFNADPLLERASEQATGFRQNLNSVSTSSFTTGAISRTQYQSVTLKGVGASYPLQGELRVSFGSEPQSVTADKLDASEAWLSGPAMTELEVSIGDDIDIGLQRYRVAGQLMFEPDRLTQLQHAIPRVMVSLEGLRAAGVAAGNTRGEHRLLVSGNQLTLAALQNAVSADQSLEVLTPKAGNHPFSRIANRAEKMLNMVVILALLMCGGAAAILANDLARRYSVSIAVLRSMGVQQRVVILSVCLQLLVLTVAASTLGGVLGWAIQPLFSQALKPHLLLTLIPFELAFVAKPLLISSLAVCCFVLPKFIALGSVPVSVILRGGSLGVVRQYWGVALITLLVTAMLWISSDNLQLTFLLLTSVLVIVSLSLILGWALSKLASLCHHFLSGAMKVAVRFIGRSPSRYSVQMISTALVMLALLLTTTLRGGFLDTLQIQMLEIDGNYLFSRIPYQQIDKLQSSLRAENITLKSVHPVVSAKLKAINHVPIDDALSHESDTREEARSRVRLSWSATIPSNNQLIAGSWPTSGANEVSVEAEVMDDLGLKLGDQITFLLSTVNAQEGRHQEQSLVATITSVRQYQSGGSRMMFWFVFPEGVLEQYDVMAMGGLLVPKESSHAATLKPIVQTFPQIKIIDLESQISGIRRVMTALTRLMNVILLTLLGAAATVIMASALVNTRSRDKLLGIMRVFGADKRACVKMGLAEQMTVALIGCLVGIISVQVIGTAMFENVFGLAYALDWQRALLLSCAFSACFALVGYLITLDGLRKPPRLGDQ